MCVRCNLQSSEYDYLCKGTHRQLFSRAISENAVVSIMNTGREQIAIREGQVAHDMPNAERISRLPENDKHDNINTIPINTTRCSDIIFLCIL